MGTLTAGLDAALAALGDNERRAARRTGELIDTLSQGLDNLKSSSSPELPPLPATTAASFDAMTDAAIKQLLKASGIKGYTSCKGKRLCKADRVALCIAHGLQPLSYDFLLAFYLQHSRKN